MPGNDAETESAAAVERNSRRLFMGLLWLMSGFDKRKDLAAQALIRGIEVCH